MKQSDVGGANRGVANVAAVDSGVVQHGAGVLVSWSDISCHAAHWTGHSDTYIHRGGRRSSSRCKGSTVHLSTVDGRHWKLATFMYRKVWSRVYQRTLRKPDRRPWHDEWIPRFHRESIVSPPPDSVLLETQAFPRFENDRFAVWLPPLRGITPDKNSCDTDKGTLLARWWWPGYTGNTILRKISFLFGNDRLGYRRSYEERKERRF